ncbi:hypothetical protein KVV02_007440 [Mortierella alpina]|uniref:Rho-GAP domain-containing protein n=1 Tax=Mortierella alpina TaxID=64518 RepID=A0A9P8A568_MORAP|nr:hypothetical protein KVV02_007440 [Mortierella alpina]
MSRAYSPRREVAPIRPTLEQEDIKAQFNSIVSPYGILFADQSDLPLSFLGPTLAREKPNSRATNDSWSETLTLQDKTLTSTGDSCTETSPVMEDVAQMLPTSYSSMNSSKDSVANIGMRRSHHPSASQDAGQSLNTIASEKDLDDTSTAAPAKYSEGEYNPQWRPSYDLQRDGTGTKGIKPGSKLVKGWKKLRQSLRHSAMAGQRTKHQSGSQSSVAEGRLSESALRLGEERKTLSDMDHRPFEIGSDETLNFGPGFGIGLSSKFSSGSLKGFMLKGPSTASLSESDASDALQPKRLYKDSQEDLEGGAVVVDVETVMGLGRMRQYGREDRMQQQKMHQTLEQEALPRVDTQPRQLPLTDVPALVDTRPALPHSLQPEQSVQAHKDDQHLEEPNSEPLRILEEPLAPQHAASSSNEQTSDGSTTEKEPFVIPRTLRLGHDLSASQRWRLSARGSPNVYGSICERAPTDSCANELFLQRLMRDSTLDRGTLEKAAVPDDRDRQDNAFRVPLEQSVQLASAMFENGQKVPLVVYYATEELRVRGDIVAATDSLFPEDWDANDADFEALVNVFDTRPFGQDFDLSARTYNLPLSDDANTAVRNEEPTAVSSRDLSRVILRFLADLPEPLIPQDVFTTFSAMVQLQTLDSIKVQASSLLVQLLPLPQRQLLQFLLEFLDCVILGSLREDIGRLGQNINTGSVPEQSVDQHEGDLGRKRQEYTDTVDRLSQVLGVVCMHAALPGSQVNGSMTGSNSQNSLYRHYKKEFELKALQEQKNASIQKAKAVFHALLKFRTNIFGPSSFSFAGPIDHQDEDSSLRQGNDTPQADDEHEQDSIEDTDSEYEYQSDGALMGRPRSSLLSRRRAFPRPKSYLRHAGNTAASNRRNRRRAQSSMLFGMAPRGTAKDVLCDSGADMTCSVDMLAVTAMQEHSARAKRFNKHLPHPSMATLHSILAEADSVTGTSQPLSSERLHGNLNQTLLGQGPGRGIEIYREEDIEEAGREDDTYDDELGFGSKKPRREYGFMDFLQEPLDRKQEEREIKMVEKEILQSEVTTKFLAANLAGLYPSSSQSPIPPVILPSARGSLMPPSKSVGQRCITLQQPAMWEIDSPLQPEESQSRVRELTLTPQEQIALPLDHRASDDCSCSFCTTLVKPSKIPVLTREEYERAELQSQCDAKDLHIAELLKTVQGLQSQVNILNAKLLFLHDHHTTRPMRRRTLVRGSQSGMPSVGGVEWFSRHQHQVTQQSSGSEDSKGFGSSAEPTGSNITSVTTQSCSPRLTASPKTFAEGLHSANNSDAHLNGGTMSQPWPSGLEEDEAMSLLDLEDNYPAAPTCQPYQQPMPPSMTHTLAPFPRNVANPRRRRYETELERVLRDVEEAEEEPEREGEDMLDEYYYMDAYKTMDQQLYRRPILPVSPPPRPMSSDQYKKHHRMSLPIQSLMSKRISLANSFRWKGRATAA